MVEESPFSEWIGRQSRAEDVVDERLVASFCAVLEPHLAPVPAGCAPLGIHWCLSPAIAGMAELGPDGHPTKSRDMPPVPQPRRMWAGGALTLLAPLRLGDRVTRLSTIAGIVRKEGRSGELWFVTVQHDYVTERGVAVRERQDIVYREAAKLPADRPAATESPRRRAQSWTVETTPTYLFRYSAITFNGHRIHYDFPYATQIEGYPGVVVHGPLQATLLLNLAAVVAGEASGTFAYRGLSPAIVGDALEVCAGGEAAKGTYWTQGPSGQIHMEATLRSA